jgi:hypothetical protein
VKRALPVLLLLFTCKQTVDPNKGKYSCITQDDCGGGYECWPQFAGGSLCFPTGQCTKIEQCNGKDDNCDGRVDETFPQAGMGCMTGRPGPCNAGADQCVDGGIVCISPYVPVAETCNGIDDNCNGMTDETFNFATDSLNCGKCGNACASGAACGNGICFETNCADGLDNDNDGGADCLDPACRTKPCGGDDGGFNCGAMFFDGGMDAGLDAGLDAGPGDGGMDAGFDGGTDGGFDAGLPTVPACVPRETICDDGFDNDLDGLTDCADNDCNGQTCATSKTCSNGTCQ